jgi:hypothetical protein
LEQREVLTRFPELLGTPEQAAAFLQELLLRLAYL